MGTTKIIPHFTARETLYRDELNDNYRPMLHSTEHNSEQLIKTLVNYSKHGDLFFDLFAGSYSSLCACILLPVCHR